MSHRATSLFPAAVLLLIAWGALAFGAEYTWTYAPLLVLAVTAGVLGMIAGRGGSVHRGLGVALASVAAAASLQLVPLSEPIVRSVSRASVSADYNQLYAKATMQESPPASGPGRRPLSIAPSRTVVGLVCLAALSILFIGTVRGLNALGAVTLARGVLIIGVVVGMIELIQRASGSDVAYGFWHAPHPKQHQSAPFLNRNHAAGWLLMALSLSAGHFVGMVASGRRRAGDAGWHERVLRLSSRRAGDLLMTGAAIAVMAVAVIVTASRSGAFGFALAILMFCWWGRRLPSVSRKLTTYAFLVAMGVAALSLGGLDRLAGRFTQTSWADLDGRLRVWQDTVRIIGDSPLTGTGLNTFGIAMLHYQTVDDDVLYIESHNDYLQLAAEGGLLLGIPILITIGLFIREVRRRFKEAADDTTTYWLRVGAVVGLIAIAAQETVEFTLQMPGAVVLFVVLAAVAIHRPDYLRREARAN